MQRNFFLWLSSFISFRFSGFPLTPLTFQSLLCKLYLFLFLVYFYIFFPSFFLLLFHRFSRLTCWSALIAISHDICTIFVCLQSQLPGTVSYVAQAARRVLSTDLVSPLSPSSSLSPSLYYLFTIFSYSKWSRKPLRIIDGKTCCTSPAPLPLPAPCPLPLLGPHPFGRSHFQLQFYPQLNRNPFPLAILFPSSPSSFLLLSFAISPRALPSLASSPFSLVVAKKFSTQFTKFACCLCCFCFCLHFFLSLSPSPRLLSMIIFALFASQRLLTFRLCRWQGQRGVSSSLGARQLGSDCSQFESHWQCTVWAACKYRSIFCHIYHAADDLCAARQHRVGQGKGRICASVYCVCMCVCVFAGGGSCKQQARAPNNK